MRDLPVINDHGVKAYCSASTRAALVIIWLCILLEFTKRLFLSLWPSNLQTFLLNLPCKSNQLPYMAEMLCLIQSFYCWCFPSIPTFEAADYVHIFKIIFHCILHPIFSFKATPTFLSSFQGWHTLLQNLQWSLFTKNLKILKSILNTQILWQKLSIYPIPLKEVI